MRPCNAMTGIEIFAAICGLVAVWLTTRQHILTWPIGLVQVVLYVFIFYNAKLYSDMVLHVVYIGLQLFGWYNWLHGGTDRGELKVSRMTTTQRTTTVTSIICITCIWGYLMGRYTDAHMVYPDAFIAVTSLASQWFLTKKKLESWYGWILVDVVAVIVYVMKDLTVTAILYAVFLVLAVSGASQWKRSLRSIPVAV